MLMWFWLVWLLVFLFLVGSCVGSFLNVCIGRLPAGKSLFWPPSHCGQCGGLIRSRDNLPILSYWILGGRCRVCGAPFSMRYFWVELIGGLAFVLLFVLEVGLNIHRIDSFGPNAFWYLQAGRVPDNALPFVVVHLLAFCLLLVAYCCNLDRHGIPVSVLLMGLLLAGLAGVLFPWPWPDQRPEEALLPGTVSRSGLQLWPLWTPLPDFLPAGNWQLGLANVVVGALVGGAVACLLRLALLRGSVREALLQGDASLGLLAGAFLGWQPTLAAELGGTGTALVLALLSGRPRQTLGALLSCLLGPALLLTWLGWPWLGPALCPLLFSLSGLGWLLLGGCALGLILALLSQRSLPAREAVLGKPTQAV